MSETMQLVLFFAGQLVTAAAIWGGLKVEIRSLHEKVAANKEAADHAHERIDLMLGLGDTGSHPVPRRGR